MRQLILIISLILLVGFSCKNKQKTAEASNKPALAELSEKAKEESEKVQDEVKEDVKEETSIQIAKWIYPENTIAGIKRTYCFGKCQVYEMVLLDDYTLMYTGEANVDKIGSYVAQASEEDFNKLISFANEVGYFELKDEYVGEVSDLPTTYTTLKVGNQRKSIVNLFMGPEELGQFEKYFDQLFANQDWQKVE